MEHSIGSFTKEFKKEISTYVDVKLEYTKLVAYEKIAKTSAASASFFIIAFFAFFTFLFLSITGGYYLGEVTGSVAKGFGIITITYLILLVAVITVRKKFFEEFIIDKVLAILTDDDDERNKTEQTESTTS
jgi:hypothetical protein